MYHSSVEKLIEAIKPARILTQTFNVVQFDNRTVRPTGGSAAAAERVGWLAEQAHTAATSEEVLFALIQCEQTLDELTPLEQLAVKRLSFALDRAVSLPPEFVQRREATYSQANDAWQQARQNSDFSKFAEHLAEVFELARQQAVFWGATEGDGDSMYDALFSQYEPGVTFTEMRPVLDQLGEFVAAYVDRVKNSGITRTNGLMRGCFPKGRQQRLIKFLVSRLGYDFNRGAMAETTHPFASTIARGDHRITGRFYENFLGAALFGFTHETGHSMFDQASPDLLWEIDNVALPISLTLHESQSRLWENMVCRSWEFWEYFYPYLQIEFPVFAEVPLSDFYQAINVVVPSAIRVESDEVTYQGHIIVRSKIEPLLLSKQISASDVPAMFNDLMEKFVGYRPVNDREGCLQDVHWSFGLVGYAPTYSFGNVAAAQFMAAFTKTHPNYKNGFRAGNFWELLHWLNENIHATGHLESMPDVLTRVTGRPLEITDWIQYIHAKFDLLYPVSN